MNEFITGELARIRQAELMAEADARRLAKAVKTADPDRGTRLEVRAVVATLRARLITRTNAPVIR